MATRSVPSEIIERERKKLVEILQQDPDSILDTLTSRKLISDEEYESLENITDPHKKSRKLLILVQKKGEVSCQHFLKCLCSTFPQSVGIWDLNHEFLKNGVTELPLQSMGISKYLEDVALSEEKHSENPEITVNIKEKEYLDLEASEYFKDNKIGYRETALSSRVNKKENSSPEIATPYLVENFEYEIPATTEYLQDGQRYKEPDGSLYLGEEDYIESAGYSKDAETTMDEEFHDDLENIVYDGKDSPYGEITEYSDEEQCDEEPEASMSLEEEKKHLEERKKVFEEVMSCLNMDRNRKLLPDFVKQFSLDREARWVPQSPEDLVWNFLMKVQALDVMARDSVLTHRAPDEDSEGDLLTGVENLEIRDMQTINPLDVLCAAMLCSDSTLQREVMSNMYRCQFALPLLLPDAENNRSILMLGAMRDIVKEQSAQSSGEPTVDTEKLLTRTKMPVISFVRLGYCSYSKSKILNRLLSPAGQKPHKIFLHQDFLPLVLPRQISNGLVEIAWYFPESSDVKANLSFCQKPVAVTNLRGDLESFWTQFGFLMEVSSAVFFFTDCLGQKEWDLLMFLGEETIKRCYFVLSSQAKESEKAEILQRLLNLKMSQLLFWEEEERAEETGKNMERLQAALHEAMSSSLRYVSLEDMASLAWELGIQVDQEFEKNEEIQVAPSENMAGIAEDKEEQRHNQLISSSESSVEMPVKEPGVQNFYLFPVLMPHLENSCSAPSVSGGNLNRVSWNAPRVVGSHFWSEQRAKWFCPLPFQNRRAHSQGKCFGIQYFQPQRSYSGERFMKSSRPTWGYHIPGTFGRPPNVSQMLRHVAQHVQAWAKRPHTTGALQSSGAVPSQGAHFQSQGYQPAGADGKRTSHHIRYSYPQAFSPAHSKFAPRLQFKSDQPNPSQVKHPQQKPFQPQPPQTKSTQSQPSKNKYFASKSTQSKQCQPQPSQSKPFQHHPTQAKPSSSKSTQSTPHQPRSSQTSQHRPAQPKSSQTRPSQAKTYHPRAGPKRGGKH